MQLIFHLSNAISNSFIWVYVYMYACISEYQYICMHVCMEREKKTLWEEGEAEREGTEHGVGEEWK